MKKLIINYETEVENCGECWHDMDTKCELTNSIIADHWDGVLDDCPLEDIKE